LDDWKTFYEFYKSTYLERMQAPYLNFSFFELIHKNKDILQPVIFFAELNEQSVAGSLCFQGKDILYGRHWGASMMVDSLHFECCYYQGIDYCIKNNIKYFDPGVQGEHKIRRGFEPRLCNSYHYVIKEDFRKAIDSFCIEEYKSIEQYLMACEKYTPIKKEYRI
ncbi:GNAT family N-acetyltransferase, partial [Gammaproteobacteria bacterium]|nr:GNAT family N-acetyltransferase [Gammaproteobacteria bacterium]